MLKSFFFFYECSLVREELKSQWVGRQGEESGLDKNGVQGGSFCDNAGTLKSPYSPSNFLVLGTYLLCFSVMDVRCVFTATSV